MAVCLFFHGENNRRIMGDNRRIKVHELGQVGPMAGAKMLKRFYRKVDAKFMILFSWVQSGYYNYWAPCQSSNTRRLKKRS
jgi:hypothetical protein